MDEKNIAILAAVITIAVIAGAFFGSGLLDEHPSDDYSLMPKEVPATEIHLDKNTLTLGVGGEYTINATVTPEDSSDSVVWTSSDASVATVSDGKVKAISAGKATIVANAGSTTAKCEVTVLNVTPEMEKALEKAGEYVEYGAMSRAMIWYKLRAEGYSDDVAVYAVDNCKADWNKQAVTNALEYLDKRGYSQDHLRIILTDVELFSDDQAEYGVDNCGADWGQQAKRCA